MPRWLLFIVYPPCPEYIDMGNDKNGLSRNRSSNEIAGISLYDGNGLVIDLSFIDNKLSMGGL